MEIFKSIPSSSFNIIFDDPYDSSSWNINKLKLTPQSYFVYSNIVITIIFNIFILIYWSKYGIFYWNLIQVIARWASLSIFPTFRYTIYFRYTIFVLNARFFHFSGLCGDYNGDSTDDLSGFLTVNDFGNSHKITGGSK